MNETVRIDDTVGVFACCSTAAGRLGVGYVHNAKSVGHWQFFRHVDLFKDVLHRRRVLRNKRPKVQNTHVFVGLLLLTNRRRQGNLP